MDRTHPQAEHSISTGLPLPDSLLEEMDSTPQNPRYHAEGSVLKHTELVLKAYQEHRHRFELDSQDHEVLYWAAILHDVGKPSTTRWENERWRAKGHERAGVPIARDFLLTQPQISAYQRKRILDLVRYHAVPLQWGLHPRALPFYYRLATRTDLRMVGIFGYFDIVGRYCENKKGVMNMVDRFVQELVPRIEYEMGTYAQVQECYRKASLRHKNALWYSLRQEDAQLLLKLINADTAADTLPQFHCVIPVGADSPQLRHFLDQEYPGHKRYDAARLDPARQGKFDLETQLRPLKHFVSVYGQAQKSLLFTGLPIDDDLRTTVANYCRQHGGAVEFVLFEERLESLLAEEKEKVEADRIRDQHRRLLVPHPWGAHRLRLASERDLGEN